MVAYSTPTVESPRVSYPISATDARFWGHFTRPGRGINVFKLTDGTFTDVQPWDPSTVSVAYYGGHLYDIAQDELNGLIAAGFAEGDIVVPPDEGGPTGNLIGDFDGVLVGDEDGHTISEFA
jgi:hypothetical protein